MNKIICTNSMEYMESGKIDGLVDLTVTSPPYDEIRSYEGYDFDSARMIDGLWRVTADGGVVVWVVGDKISDGNRSLTSLRHAIAFQERGFRCNDIVIYAKKQTPFFRSNAYTQAHELMFVFSKGKIKTFNPLMKKSAGKLWAKAQANKRPDGTCKMVSVKGEAGRDIKRTNIWTYSTARRSAASKLAFEHPAIFPEALARDCVLSWSNKGDLVFDPMNGSGTTTLVADQNGRKWLGLDISEKYCDLARRRMEECLV